MLWSSAAPVRLADVTNTASEGRKRLYPGTEEIPNRVSWLLVAISSRP